MIINHNKILYKHIYEEIMKIETREKQWINTVWRLVSGAIQKGNSVHPERCGNIYKGRSQLV